MSLFQLLLRAFPPGAVRIDMYTVRLVGGVVADQVMREGVLVHNHNNRLQLRRWSRRDFLSIMHYF